MKKDKVNTLRSGTHKRVSFATLRLDEENPRLPERSERYTQSELMLIFYRDYALDELTESYAANGFFQSESLIVLQDGTVIEGNRRLAALKYLFHDKDATEAGLPICDSVEQISEEAQDHLKNDIPVLVVEDRDELVAYLGFRHINGTKEWPSASKARFVYSRVEHYASEKVDVINVFKRVGHEIGSNANGARGWYINYALVRQARELGLQDLASKLLLSRFGVWRRLCGDQIYRYIGFDSSARTYEEIQQSLESLDVKKFEELLRDIVPDQDGNILLRDSRRATDYTTILADSAATATLRATRDFDVALLVAEGSPVNRHLQKALAVMDVASTSLENDAPVDEGTQMLVKRLRKKLDAIDGLVHGAILALENTEV